MVSLQPITLYELLSLGISIAGFATVIITLVLLIRQTREMTTQTKYVAETLKSSAYEIGSNEMFTVAEIFINYPELRPYFYSGRDIGEDDPSYSRVAAVAEFLLNFFGSVLLQMEHFPGVWPRKSWETYIIDSFANSPVLCRYLESVDDWYIDELVALMRAGQEQRPQGSKQID